MNNTKHKFCAYNVNIRTKLKHLEMFHIPIQQNSVFTYFISISMTTKQWRVCFCHNLSENYLGDAKHM